MTHVLHIDATANMTDSISRAASNGIVADLGGQHPDLTVTYRDLSVTPLPQIDGAWVKARLSDPETRSQADKAHLALSDILVAEMQAADIIVIGTPLYNFAGPASLKAWMDLVARPRVTFQYLPDGPEGLLNGKTAIITVASGGVPVGSAQDFLTPHIKVFLAFLGITDVTVIDAKTHAALPA